MIVFVLSVCLIMILFAVYLARWVVAKDEGTAEMQEVGCQAGNTMLQCLLHVSITEHLLASVCC